MRCTSSLRDATTTVGWNNAHSHADTYAHRHHRASSGHANVNPDQFFYTSASSYQVFYSQAHRELLGNPASRGYRRGGPDHYHA